MSIGEVEWLESEARRLISSCESVSTDGAPIYSPDASANFQGTWIRDFEFMVEGCPGAVPLPRVLQVIEKLIQGQLENGSLPNKYVPSGRYAYLVKGCGDRPPTDNPQYLVKLVCEYWRQSGDDSLFRQASTNLERALMSLPLDNSTSLVWIAPTSPHSGYGFTDAIAKTGCELFSSILLWEAHRRMADLYMIIGSDRDAERHDSLALQICSSIGCLWDEDSGAFLAATHHCRQIDIWGSAYAVETGFATADQSDSISRFLVKRFSDYTLEGQVRHIIEPSGWQRLIAPLPIGTSQNGAFWGIPSGWVAGAISITDRRLGKRMLEEMIRSYRTNGVYEWINSTGRHNAGYVASAALPLKTAKSLLRD
jgi:hypothetical protein